MPRSFDCKLAMASTLLLAAGCQIGGSTAIAPSVPDASRSSDTASGLVGGDGGTGGLVDAGQPELQAPDASRPEPTSDAGDPDSGAGPAADAAAQCDAGLCGQVPATCSTAAYGGHGYLFCSDQLTWSQARARCTSLGLDLVVIDDAAENAFVAAHLKATSWLGANDQATEGTWRWIVPGSADVSGAALSYTDWSATAPDNCGGGVLGDQDCGRIAADGSWEDSACDGGCLEGPFAVVCESY